MCHLKVIPIHFLEPEIGPINLKNQQLNQYMCNTARDGRGNQGEGESGLRRQGHATEGTARDGREGDRRGSAMLAKLALAVTHDGRM